MRQIYQIAENYFKKRERDRTVVEKRETMLVNCVTSDSWNNGMRIALFIRSHWGKMLLFNNLLVSSKILKYSSWLQSKGIRLSKKVIDDGKFEWKTNRPFCMSFFSFPSFSYLKLEFFPFKFQILLRKFLTFCLKSERSYLKDPFFQKFFLLYFELLHLILFTKAYIYTYIFFL